MFSSVASQGRPASSEAKASRTSSKSDRIGSTSCRTPRVSASMRASSRLSFEVKSVGSITVRTRSAPSASTASERTSALSTPPDSPSTTPETRDFSAYDRTAVRSARYRASRTGGSAGCTGLADACQPSSERSARITPSSQGLSSARTRPFSTKRPPPAKTIRSSAPAMLPSRTVPCAGATSGDQEETSVVRRIGHSAGAVKGRTSPPEISTRSKASALTIGITQRRPSLFVSSAKTRRTSSRRILTSSHARAPCPVPPSSAPAGAV